MLGDELLEFVADSGGLAPRGEDEKIPLYQLGRRRAAILETTGTWRGSSCSCRRTGPGGRMSSYGGAFVKDEPPRR